MAYRILADLVVIVHVAFVLFVVLGGLLVWRWRPVMWAHLPAAIWGALVEFAGWICPLTPLENWFRQRGQEAGYTGGFVDHYLIAMLYPEQLTRELQMVLGFAILAVNSLVYWRAFSRAR
jgi:hypothetical protein